MKEVIKNFSKQFKFEPTIKRTERLSQLRKFTVIGMGGSHLAADLLKAVYPELPITTHSNYGLPLETEEYKKETLFIISSYSGNTEETIDALHIALKNGFSCAATSTGGRLRDIALKYDIPFVEIPSTGVQPRSALGYSLLGLTKLMGLEKASADIHTLAEILKPEAFEEAGKSLAKMFKGKVPIIYVSFRNQSIAYNWKIKANESAKIPAFYNVFPELNHNEMTGFDVIDSTRSLSENFYVVFITDSEDDPRIQRRMEVCKKLYENRGIPVATLSLEGDSRWERIFNSLFLADWFSYYTALQYGTEPEEVPMVEEFKKILNT